MPEDEVTEGTIWILAHWLLPSRATKEEAYELIGKAKCAYMTGLELKEKDW